MPNDFIELGLEHGGKVMVRISEVASIVEPQYSNRSTTVIMKNGQRYQVNHSYETLSRVIGGKSD